MRYNVPMPEFIRGLELCRRFYEEAVRPVLSKHFPDLPYSAARLGHGSEILEYDTERSTDHHWGPSLDLFLREKDSGFAGDIKAALSEELPHEFLGYPVDFSPPDAHSVRLMAKIESGPVSHMVRTTTVPSFFRHVLGFSPTAKLTVADWLSFPQQELLTITRGQVYHDGLGTLNRARRRFTYYPHDVWLYLIACQWRKIEQEEAFSGRCAEVGDEIGSRIVAARLVREIMRLCFLFEKTYFPYSKWFGTAFSGLRCAPAMSPLLGAVLSAGTWPEREKQLTRVYESAATMHNALRITQPVKATVSPFFDRPFLVIHGDEFAKATLAEIRDEEVKSITDLTGSVDQWADNTDLLTTPDVFRRAALAVHPHRH